MNTINMSDLCPEDTVTSRLQYWSVTSPETLAFVYVTPESERYAYSRKELFSLSRRAASWLHQRGVGKKDVLLCLVPTSPEQTFISLGATVLGAKTICSMVKYQDGSDIVPLINCGDVTVIVMDQAHKQVISTLETFIPNLSAGPVTSQAFPSVKTAIFCNRHPEDEELSFLELISQESEARVVDVSPDDVATIFVTSGTSGQPKLVPKTHRQIWTMAMQSYEICPTADGDVIFNGSSLGWISGYPFLYFAFGQTRVVPYVKKSPPDDEDKFLLDVLRQEKVTQLFTSPASLKKLLARNDLLKTPFTWTVRTVIFAGSVFRKEFSRILENLSVEIRVRYGCTEIGFAAYKVYIDKVQMEDFKCGKPVKGVEIVVVDDNLKEVPPNTKGNIMIKNNGFFSGYLKQPGLTAVVLPEEGWFRPGDIGWLNDEGEIFIEGRQSEAISIGSFKMFPQPLESQLMKCPGVYDVAVVAIPDKDFENVPCICLVRYPTLEGDEVVPEELIRRCSEYFQESFVHENIEQELGVPKVCLVFDKFPVNSNGKLQRRALRDMAIERLFIRQNEN